MKKFYVIHIFFPSGGLAFTRGGIADLADAITEAIERNRHYGGHFAVRDVTRVAWEDWTRGDRSQAVFGETVATDQLQTT